MRPQQKKTFILATCTVVLATSSGFVAPATAVVPPKECGIVKIAGKRYQVKADKVRCAMAVPYVRRYLRRGAPRNFKCIRSRTVLALKCDNTRASPDQEFRAIRKG